MDDAKVWTGDRIAVGTCSNPKCRAMDRKLTWKIVISRELAWLVWISAASTGRMTARDVNAGLRRRRQADTWAHQTTRVNFVYVLPISDDRDGMSLAIYWNLANLLIIVWCESRPVQAQHQRQVQLRSITPIAWHHLSFPELRRELARINGSSLYMCVSQLTGFSDL